ncbi:MAG: fluoride efflux transporter CrcB [Clostridia bacterium]|nr:fluoride efflux transporter CrcB [Clostridia bacterium]
MEYLFVGFGGMMGGLVRFIIGKKMVNRNFGGFPFSTYLVNISGAVLLGVVNSLDITRNAYLLLADGFLGAYTTFSTFMYEGFNFISNKKMLNACIYIVGTLVSGLIGFIFGDMIGKLF